MTPPRRPDWLAVRDLRGLAEDFESTAIRGPRCADIPGNDPGPADPARPLLRDIVSRGTLFQTVRIRPSPHANQATSRNRLVGTEIRPSVPDLAPRRGATDEGPAPFGRPQGDRHAAKRDYPGAYAPPSLGRVLIARSSASPLKSTRARPTRSRGAIVARGLRPRSRGSRLPSTRRAFPDPSRHGEAERATRPPTGRVARTVSVVHR